jgi:uncharacterized protein
VEGLARAVDAWASRLGSRLISIALFGSIARGSATEASDIDLLVVVEGLPRSLRDRRQILLTEWSRARARDGLPAVEWNLVVKTPEEARVHSPLYLDLVEDAILLIDRERFFESVLGTMRARMQQLGSRRVFMPDGTWYWDLKPDFRFGEVVEI